MATQSGVLMLTCSICGEQVPEETIEVHASACVAKKSAPVSLIDLDSEIPPPAASAASAAPVIASPALASVATASSTEEKKKKKGFFGSLFGPSEPSSPLTAPSNSDNKGSSAPSDPPQLARDYVKGAFLVAIVDQPQKTKLATGMEAMTYRISAKSSLPEYAEKPLMQVRRSFAEFQSLHKHIVRLYPQCIVPPITDRKRMMVDDTTIAFVSARARHLQRFINRLGAHPVLAKSAPLIAFLQKEDKEWRDIMNALDNEEKDILARTPKRGWFGSAAPAEFSKEEGAAVQSLRAFALEAKELEAVFRGLTAYAKTVIAKRGEVQTTMTTIGKDFDKISASKGIVAPQSMITNTQLTNCLSALMTTWTQMVGGEEKIAEADTDGLYECLKEWAYYAKAAQEWVTRYEGIREQHALSVNALKKSAEDTALAQRVVETDKIIDLIIHTSPEEIKRFDEFRIKEIIHWTRYYAKVQIDAHKQAIEVWEKYLKNFK
eukprot:TRINITY_DN5245_c0_g1_i1.p2 TRINITY_DN5245_c0_g1~~TRINITY_DN5245_c0_g1_i1.p2  ORF type:complete len:501 (-),score=118.07 TRINITY_DN5245_c0_g1_i1:1558-3030(-)